MCMMRFCKIASWHKCQIKMQIPSFLKWSNFFFQNFFFIFLRIFKKYLRLFFYLKLDFEKKKKIQNNKKSATIGTIFHIFEDLQLFEKDKRLKKFLTRDFFLLFMHLKFFFSRTYTFWYLIVFYRLETQFYTYDHHL